jgi:tRNA threonylcarbamoyladenosine biosynthesis protein TsaB
MIRPRIILAIETSNPSAWEPGQGSRPGVALGRLSASGAMEVVGVRHLDATKPHDDELMPEIAALVAAAGLRPRDLTDVAVSAGPGGYTAVRLAVTTAKLIAEATGARAIPVPSSLVAAWGAAGVLRGRGASRFAVAISSKGETTHLSSFWVEAAGVKALDAGVVVSAEGVQAALEVYGCRVLVGDRFLPQALRAKVQSLGVEVLPPEFDPVACLRACVGVEAVEPVALAPIYAREPEAVTKWREMGKAKSEKR